MSVQSPTALEAERLMVIAPHPDDETLGCGGMIAALADAGSRICTIFVTDGSASHSRSKTWPRDRLIAQRRSEAARALSCLGVGNHPRVFLDLPDSAIPAPTSAKVKSAIHRLRRTIAAFQPDVILLPWRRDPHRDHRDSWTLATSVVQGANQPIRTLEYAVWLEEFGAPEDQPRCGEADRVGFDVSSFVDMKQSAIAAYLSQSTPLIEDDPDGFLLSEATIQRFVGPVESYWRPAE